MCGIPILSTAGPWAHVTSATQAQLTSSPSKGGFTAVIDHLVTSSSITFGRSLSQVARSWELAHDAARLSGVIRLMPEYVPFERIRGCPASNRFHTSGPANPIRRRCGSVDASIVPASIARVGGAPYGRTMNPGRQPFNVGP